MEQNQSETIVGFNTTDSINLLGLLPNAGGELSPPTRRPPIENLLARVGTGGIAANSPGQATLYETTSTNWTLGSEVYDVHNFGTAIPPNSDCLLVPVNGRWLTVRLC